MQTNGPAVELGKNRGQVTTELIHQAGLIEELFKTADVLENRLEVVLNRETDTEGKNTVEEKPMLTELAMRLDNQNDQLRMLNVKLLSLIHRIEL